MDNVLPGYFLHHQRVECLVRFPPFLSFNPSRCRLPPCDVCTVWLRLLQKSSLVKKRRLISSSPILFFTPFFPHHTMRWAPCTYKQAFCPFSISVWTAMRHVLSHRGYRKREVKLLLGKEVSSATTKVMSCPLCSFGRNPLALPKIGYRRYSLNRGVDEGLEIQSVVKRKAGSNWRAPASFCRLGVGSKRQMMTETSVTWGCSPFSRCIHTFEFLFSRCINTFESGKIIIFK